MTNVVGWRSPIRDEQLAEVGLDVESIVRTCLSLIDQPSEHQVLAH